MNLKPEQIEQIKLFDWIRSRSDIEPFSFHIANERRVSPQHGRILKRMGVKAGVSDVFIGIPRAEFHGLFIELKADGGKLSPTQQVFLANMALNGYATACCVGYDAAKSFILSYLGENVAF